MLGWDTLDVAIGLTLVFLSASIILTAAQEGLEGIFGYRAKNLERALGELLQDPDTRAQFYQHPLIYALYRGGAEAKKRPSYIPRETFSAALIDMVENGRRLNAELLSAYQGLWRLSGGDPVRLRRELESWYDATMDRASGWYKRRAQTILFWLGLAAAIALNINAIGIAEFLNASKTQRELVVAAATKVTTPPAGQAAAKSPAGQEVNAINDQLGQIGLPIGWSKRSMEWTFQHWNEAPALRDPKSGPARSILLLAAAILAIVGGWVITALATMLGAPFWFDLLNKLMVIRSTVKPKEKSPDEPSADGGVAPAQGEAADGGAVPARRTARPEQDRIIPDPEPVYG